MRKEVVETLYSGLVVARFRLDFVGITPDWHYASFAEINVDEWVDAGIEHVGIDLDGHLCPAYHHDDIDPDAEDKVAEIREKMKTVALTTNNEEDLKRVVARLGLSHCVQAYVMEGLELPYKPHASFYEGWRKLVGNPDPATMLQMGDNPLDDVFGAQQQGMRGALMDRWDPHNFFEHEKAYAAPEL